MLGGVADRRERVLERVAVLAHGGEVFGGVGSPGRPGKADFRQRPAIGDDPTEGLVGRHPVGAAAVKRGDEAVEFLALLLEIGGRRGAVLLSGGLSSAPGVGELVDDDGFLRLGRVDLEAEVAESDVVHASADDF